MVGEKGHEEHTRHGSLRKVCVMTAIRRNKDVGFRLPLALALEVCDDNKQGNLLVLPVLTLDFNLMHDLIVFSKVHVNRNALISRTCLIVFTLCTRIVCSVAELTKAHLQKMFHIGLMDSNIPVQTLNLKSTTH